LTLIHFAVALGRVLGHRLGDGRGQLASLDVQLDHGVAILRQLLARNRQDGMLDGFLKHVGRKVFFLADQADKSF